MAVFNAGHELIRPLVCIFFVGAVATAQTLFPGEVRITSGPYQPQPQILREQTHVVRIDAIVRDMKGNIVPGLKQEDFAVFDNNRKQSISAFTVETRQLRLPSAKAAMSSPSSAVQPNLQTAAPLRPRYVALYFDDLHTKSGDMRHVQVAAENFIRTGLSVGDYIGLFTASSTSSADFTPDPSQVLNVLSKLTSRARAFDSGACPRMTPQDAYLIANHLDPEAYQVALAQAVQCNCADQANVDATCPRAQAQLVMVQAQQAWEPLKELSKSTIETIKGVIGYLEKEPGERVLVLASSGFLSGMLEAQVDGVVDDALRAGVLINALDAKGLYTEDPAHGQMHNELPANSPNANLVFRHEEESFVPGLMSLTSGMVDLVVGTGGRFFHNRNDLSAGYYSLAAAPQTEYLLGFVPEDTRENGAFHKLKVELTIPGKFDIEARPGYFASEREMQESRASTPEQMIDDAVSSTKDHADFPLAVTDRLAATKNKTEEVAVQTHVDIQKLPFAQEQDRHVDMLTFVAVLFDSQGRLVTGKEAQMQFALKADTFDRLSKTGINGGMSLEAPPGAYRLRVVVEEAMRGEMSVATRNIEVQ